MPFACVCVCVFFVGIVSTENGGEKPLLKRIDVGLIEWKTKLRWLLHCFRTNCPYLEPADIFNLPKIIFVFTSLASPCNRFVGCERVLQPNISIFLLSHQFIYEQRNELTPSYAMTYRSLVYESYREKAFHLNKRYAWPWTSFKKVSRFAVYHFQ